MEINLKLETGNLKLGLMIALLATQVFGANVTMTVNPPIISLGKTAQVTVEVRNAKRSKAPNFPRIDGLRFSGINQSSQTSRVNGKTDKSISYTANIYPQRTGEFTIGPFAYTVNGESKQLSARLKVVATAGDANSEQSWNELIFAKISSNRQKAYVQEPFELTLSVYSQPGLKIQSVNNLRGLPKTGLTTETIWKGASSSPEIIRGKKHDVHQFKATMRAVGSGVFEFAPTLTVQVAAPQQQRRDPFGALFNRSRTIPVEIHAAPTTVNVLPLPTIGKPKGFSGAVGRFNFGVTAEPKTISPGDPITLQMTILGEGNYDRIQPPALPDDAPFRLFGDAVRQQANNGVRFEQVISPRDATVTTIPPIGFSYFDSERGQYRTISSRAIPITVTATSNNTAQLFAAQDALAIQPADTPFATESDLQKITGWLKKQWKLIRPWLWILPAALGMGIFLFAVQKFIHWRRKDTVWIRRQQAPRAARKGLKAADIALRENNPPAFYEAIGSSLTEYFGNRLNLPPGEVTPATVLESLQRADLDTSALKSIFDQVEGARYGMGLEQSPEEMKQLITHLRQLFRRTEKANIFP